MIGIPVRQARLDSEKAWRWARPPAHRSLLRGMSGYGSMCLRSPRLRVLSLSNSSAVKGFSPDRSATIHSCRCARTTSLQGPRTTSLQGARTTSLRVKATNASKSSIAPVTSPVSALASPRPSLASAQSGVSATACSHAAITSVACPRKLPDQHSSCNAGVGMVRRSRWASAICSRVIRCSMRSFSSCPARSPWVARAHAGSR